MSVYVGSERVTVPDFVRERTKPEGQLGVDKARQK